MELIGILADGELHSGADIARRMQCSRTAVWKRLQQLRSVDLEIDAQPGRGYRLSRPIDLLDRQTLLDALHADTRRRIECLDVLAVTASTNEFLRAAAWPAAGRMRVALAEFQTGGRGRRGRSWLSPFGSGLCMSGSWSFPVTPPNLPALSLAAGVAVQRALSGCGPADIGLKWPNDIVAGGAKLGGLLIDVEGESAGPLRAVVGIGINIEPVADLADRFDGADALRPVGLRSLGDVATLTRNRVAGAIIDSLAIVLPRFAATGFAEFAAEWRRCDVMRGAAVNLRVGDQSTSGVAAGIDDDGALLFDDGDGVRPVLSGEVTVRAAAQGAAR